MATTYGESGAGPASTSSIAAVSRTDREMTPCVDVPMIPSWTSGPDGTSPRDGLRPNSPQAEAGIRIEPPPSLAAAHGTMPAATAAAAPPEEPPACARCSTGCGPARTGATR